MIKGIIFDVGGVLAYDVWEHLLCDPAGEPGEPLSIAAKFNAPIHEIEMIGEELWRKFDRVQGDPIELERQYWQLFLERTRAIKELGSAQVDELIAMTDAFIRPVSPSLITGLLDWLSTKGVQLGICSNNNEFWFRRQERILGLNRFFQPSRIILSCRHGITKSDARLFHTSAAKLDLDPTECAFIDDRMGNVSRAVNCGMAGILFPTEQFPSKPQGGIAYLERLLREIIP